MMEVMIEAGDGTPVPLNWFEAAKARSALLLLPALGIQCKLYQRLAAGLAERGHSVCLLEQRGHGRSPLRAARGVDYTLGDFLDHDIPAALNWLRERSQKLPVVLGGHSLGGHLATIYCGQRPDGLAGVVHLACAFPWHAAYRGRQARLVRLLCRLIPLFSVIPGYYPGQLVGFGGRESLAMMRQWSEWAATGEFDFGGRTGLAEPVAAFQGPVISIAFEADELATETAIALALSPFTGASVTRLQLGAAEQGEFLGHTGWARRPDGVVQALQAWLEGQVER